MKKLDIHIGREVFASISLVLLILVGLFTFFSFVDEIDDIGKQDYSIWLAVEYVLLEVPRHIYDLFPTSALLGSLLGLGILANNNELTVMRAAGLSTLRISTSAVRVGFALTMIVVFIGEYISTQSEQYAESLRSLAQTGGHYISFNQDYGFWARDGHNFINIKAILPENGFGEVNLYQFDAQFRLLTHLYAKKAYYQHGEWSLKEVQKDYITDKKVSREFLPEMAWHANVNPDLIKIVVLKPDKLSSVELYKYIRYLKDNEQRTIDYELAFWNRLAYPLICITMIFLAMPVVFGSLRTVPIGQRVLVGAFIGIIFYMVSQIMLRMGLVYEISPPLVVITPPVLFLTIAITLMKQKV